MIFTQDACAAAARIAMVVFDVDGVLTDGHIYMGNSGEAMKAFSAQDGMGVTLLHKAGIKTAIITGRSSDIVANRAKELKITALWQGCMDKRDAYGQLKRDFGLEDNQIAYVGDDLNDLPLLSLAGLPCTVDNGVEEVKAVAKIVSKKCGGNGGVRDIAEFVLKAQGKWDQAVASFTAETGAGKIAQ